MNHTKKRLLVTVPHRALAEDLRRALGELFRGEGARDRGVLAQGDVQGVVRRRALALVPARLPFSMLRATRYALTFSTKSRKSNSQLTLLPGDAGSLCSKHASQAFGIQAAPRW